MASFVGLVRCGSVLVLVGAVATAQRQRLNFPLADSGDVFDFEVAADGNAVVYVARRGSGQPFELHAVGLPDGATKRLEPGSAGAFELTPDGRVVYSRSGEICVVPIDGSAAPLVLAAAASFHVSPDGRFVAYRATPGLWSVPTDGSAPPALLHTSSSIHHYFDFTSDGAHVLYITEGTINHNGGSGHLYAARLDGSVPPVALNDESSEATIGSFASSPDGKSVVFRHARLETFSRRLYTAPADGVSPPVQLNPPTVIGSFEIFTTFSTPRFTPDSNWVVYQLDPDVRNETELFTAPTHGGQPAVELNAPLPAGGQVVLHRVTRDGADVVYLADQEVLDRFELYAVPLRGGEPRRLNRPGEHVFWFELSPDGEHVAYIGDLENDGDMHLMFTSIKTGSDIVELSDPDRSLTDDQPSTITFDGSGRRIVFLGRRGTGAASELHPYAVRTDGSSAPLLLDAPSVAGARVIQQESFLRDSWWVRFAAHDTLAVYMADLERDGVNELWASPVAKRKTTRH